MCISAGDLTQALGEMDIGREIEIEMCYKLATYSELPLKKEKRG